MYASPFAKPREAMQLMPIAAMALIVLLLGVLLWLLHQKELDEERQSLIKDILWAEQILRFQLSSDEEKLQHLAAALSEQPESSRFLSHARQLLAGQPEMRRIVWLDGQGRPLASQPPLQSHNGSQVMDWVEALTIARSMGKPTYSTQLPPEEGEAGFVLHVPIFAGDRFIGSLAALIGYDRMLGQHVPWWFAQKYQLSVVDAAGKVLATKSHFQPPDGKAGPSYVVPFEPPGKGLTLVATVHRSGSSLASNVLVAAIFGLAASALWSLWAMRRHSRRRIEAEHALLEQHAFRKAMEDSLTVGMRARDLDGRIIYVNPAFCRMVGLSAEELIGCRPPMPYWAPEEMEKTTALNQAVLEGKAPPEGFELRLRRKDGECFEALIYEAPLIDAMGRQTGWMGSVVEMTERKRATELARQQQETLQQTARLIAMGEMASSFAHELNQPLAAIASYNTGCVNKLASGRFDVTEMLGTLGKLGAQAERAGKIIRRIHDFVRKREPVVASCTLEEVIEDSIQLIQNDARARGVTIEKRVPVEPTPIRADRILLEQVVLNLVRNGIDALGQMPRGRRLLSITAERAEATVTVRVTDRGCGVSPEAEAKLFTAFFSTKEQGMGMGLNICRSIIEYHQGRLWYEPNPEGGSMFQFTLPVAAQ